MQLSHATLDVLKNFSTIQNSIVLREGSVIFTISQNRTIVARADIPEVFDRDVPILNGLSQFLNTLKLFDGTPEITLEDTFMRVSLNRQSQIFRYSDDSFITKPKRDPLENDGKATYNFSFKLTEEDLTKIKKASSIQGLPNLVIRGRDGKVTAVVCDASGKSGSSQDEYVLDVGVETEDTFQIVLLISNIQVLNREYEVFVAGTGNMQITKWVFNGTYDEAEGIIAVPVTYWIVVEAEATYYRVGQ